MAPKSLFERPIVPRPKPNVIYTCEHPKIIEGNNTDDKIHLECKCPCKECFNSRLEIGKRCIAANHCSVHFNINTHQRKY